MTQYTPSGGTATSYTYNGDWVRTKKTTGSTITEYCRDVAGDLPRVAADKTGTTWNYYVYGSKNSLIGKVGADNVARYYHYRRCSIYRYDGTGHVQATGEQSQVTFELYTTHTTPKFAIWAKLLYPILLWGCSSAGRAFGWQPKGQGFESPQLHH